jgi:geranylgeranyl pyrophosphate synthase
VFGIEESHRMAADLTRAADESLERFGESAAPLHALANLILKRDH